MKNSLSNKIVILVLIAIVATITGCGGGGGGGGGGGDTGPAAAGSKISESTTAQELIAWQIANNVSTLQSHVSPSIKLAKRANSSIRAVQNTTLGVGRERLIFQNDSLVENGLTLTYQSGYQDYILKDSFGNYTDNENIADYLEIINNNVKCIIADSGNSMSMLINGSMVIQGFHLFNAINLKLQNLTIAGNINSDTFTWRMNANVSINAGSYPYPVNGSTESGTLVFNGYSYNYSIAYNGTNIAVISFTGAESFAITINMATGNLVTIG